MEKPIEKQNKKQGSLWTLLGCAPELPKVAKPQAATISAMAKLAIFCKICGEILPQAHSCFSHLPNSESKAGWTLCSSNLLSASCISQHYQRKWPSICQVASAMHGCRYEPSATIHFVLGRNSFYSYHIIRYHTISYHIIRYHTISYHIIPYHTI